MTTQKIGLVTVSSLKYFSKINVKSENGKRTFYTWINPDLINKFSSDEWKENINNELSFMIDNNRDTRWINDGSSTNLMCLISSNKNFLVENNISEVA